MPVFENEINNTNRYSQIKGYLTKYQEKFPEFIINTEFTVLDYKYFADFSHLNGEGAIYYSNMIKEKYNF